MVLERVSSRLGHLENARAAVNQAVNIFDRANFGIPSLLAYTGSADNEAPLTTFGRIRTTVTSARQIQLGIRATF